VPVCGSRFAVRGLLVAGALVATSTLPGAALASATTNQVPGATYKGQINHFSNVPVSFKVSSNGKKVTKIEIPQPLQLTCLQGKAGPPETSESPSVAISANGTFSASIHQKPELEHMITVKIHGRFLSGGRETGTVAFSYEFSSSEIGQITGELGCKAPFVASGTYETRSPKKAG
jgi:hypothetical protein